MERVIQKKRSSYQATSNYYHPAHYYPASRATYNRKHAAKLREKGGIDNEFKASHLESEAEIFEHPPHIEWDHPQWSEQDRALQYLFQHAYEYALNIPIQLISRTEINESIAERRGAASRLRNEAKNLRSFGMETEALELERIARWCDEDAIWIDPDEEDPWLVQRHGDDPQLRGLVVWLSTVVRRLFGESFSGILATIANVALDRNDVTTPQVREMLRSRD
jgi:hypothetical protein